MSNYVEKLYNLSLKLRKQFLSHILILHRFDQFFSFFFYEYLHFRQRYWCIWFHKKKELCIWYHFIEQNFQIHFVNVFLLTLYLFLFLILYTIPDEDHKEISKDFLLITILTFVPFSPLALLHMPLISFASTAQH